MAEFLSKLFWIKNKAQKGSKQEITNWKEINISLSGELKNNKMVIKVENDFADVSKADSTSRRYNSDLGELLFEPDDKFQFYAKYDRNGSGLDLGTDSGDLVFFGDLREIGSEVEDKSTIPLTCTDRTFNLLNRIGWANYPANGLDSGGNQKAPNGQGWTAPLMIKDILRQRAGTNRIAKSKDELIYDNEGHITPSGTNSTEFLLIDARLHSEVNSDGKRGFIQDNRSITITKDGTSVTRTIGTPDSDNSLFPSVPIGTRNYNFPFKKFVRAGKPIYEMLQNLSQIDMTNTEDELDPDNASFNIIIQRAMRYHFDEQNRFHWFYPIDNTFADSASTSATDSKDKFGNNLDLVLGDDSIYEIKRHNLKFALFETVNFIAFEAGIDMNGDSILGFRYDPTSGAPVIKDSRRSYPRIPGSMKAEDDIKNSGGHIRPDQTLKSGYAYPTDYSLPTGITPLWNINVTVKNDAEYNTEFKNEARRRGNAKADSIIRGASSQRWKGTIEMAFHNLTVNDLIRFTSNAGGIYRQKLRINEINHNIQKSGSFTTLHVEQDGKELKS